MTRPRSQQINDPSTRYTKIALPSLPSAGDSQSVLSGIYYTNFVNSSTTQLAAGAELQCPAILTASSTDPYTLSIGSSFSIAVNGNAPVTVTLTASEFVTLNGSPVAIGHRVALLINTTLGFVNPAWSSVASRTNDGFLSLASPTTGADSSISISGLAVVLQTLGFGSVISASAYGKPLARGIVTSEPDGKGGYLFAFWNDGRKLLASTNTVYTVGSNTSPVLSQAIPGGAHLYGRLSTNSTPSFVINWSAKSDSSEPISSRLSDFNTLGSGETLILTVSDLVNLSSYTFTTTFASTPATVQDVANTINASWDTATSGGLHAKVVGSNSAPFYVPSGNLVFSLNGNTNITVTFNGSERTSSDVVTQINAAIAVAAQGSQGVSVVNGNTFHIKSLLPTAGGALSTVEISTSSDTSTLKSLGLSTGLFKGWTFCVVVGAEIRLSHPSYSSKYMIGSASTALTKLGLLGYPVSPTYIPLVTREISCGFPEYSNLQDSVSLLIPEYMEAGDVLDNGFTTEKFLETVTNHTIQYPNLGGSDAVRFGSEARYGTDGKLSVDSLPYNLGFTKIGRFAFPDAPNAYQVSNYTSAGYDPIYELANSGNPSLRSYSFDDTSSGPGFIHSVNARKTGVNQFTSDVNNRASSVFEQGKDEVSISLRNASVADPYTAERDLWLKASAISGPSRELKFSKDTVVNYGAGAARFSDLNIQSNTTSGLVSLTGAVAANGDGALRLSDHIVENRSLIQFINARLEITCGDGVDTFGDFNGVDALEQAAAFLAAIPSNRPAVINLKTGDYQSTNKISFSQRHITIMGEGNSTINAPSTVGDDTLEFNTEYRQIRLSNISVSANPGKLSIIVNQNSIIMDMCTIIGDTYLKTGSTVEGGSFASFRNCIFYGSSTALTFEYVSGDNDLVSPIVFDGCSIRNSGSADVSTMKIKGINGSSRFSSISFRNSKFSLSHYSAPSAPGGSFTLPHSSVNTGLVELVPLNDGRSSSGLVINLLSYENCTIEAINSGGYSTVIQVCSAPTNQHATQYSTGNPWGQINSLVFRDCSLSATLNGSLSGYSLAYFIVGHGVYSLLVDGCDFHPLTPGNMGVYGYLPDWFKFTSSVGSGSIYTGISIGCSHASILDTRINEIPVNVGRGTFSDCDLYAVAGSSLKLDGINIKGIPYSTSRGNGSARGNIVKLYTCITPSDPIYGVSPQVSFLNSNIEGVLNTNSEWLGSSDFNSGMASVLSLGTNTIVDRVNISNFKASTPLTDIKGVYISGHNASVSNNIIADVSIGIHNIVGNGAKIVNNTIYVGEYRGSGNPSSGIMQGASGIDTIDSLLISGNNIYDTSNDNTYSSINLVIHELFSVADSVSPALKLLNNYVQWTVGKFPYYLIPANIGSDPVDAKGIIIGNSASIPGPSFIPRFLIRNYLGSGSYGPIDNYNSSSPTNVNNNKLIGAETDTSTTNVLKSRQITWNTSDSAWHIIPVEYLPTDSLIVGNLPDIWDMEVGFDVNIYDVNADTEVDAKLVYSYDSITWNDVPFQVWEDTGPSHHTTFIPNGKSSLISMNGKIETLSPNIYSKVWLGLSMRATSTGWYFRFMGKARSPKLAFRDQGRMINNTMLLSTY